MAISLPRLIGRGAVAGGVAGLLSGAVSFLLGRPAVERAIDLEQAGADARGVEVFSRVAQQVGLFVTSLLTGLAIGVLFAVVYAVRYRGDPGADAWRRSVRLAAAGFVALSLVPFLRYPANPPGVGTPGTVDDRTSAYLLAIVLGIATLVVADRVAHGLRNRRASARQLAVGGVLIAGVASTWLLPEVVGRIEVPAELLWEFRLASIAALLTLWTALGAGFGLLGERVAERTGSGGNAPAGVS